MKNIKKNKVLAVLTGDVVRSTDLSHDQYEDLLYTLHNQLELTRNHNSKNAYEITRGDTFQVILYDPENAIKYALLIRTGLKKINAQYDCRISIGISGDLAIRHRVGNSTGDAFTLSGRTLDDMKSETLRITSTNKNFDEHFSLLTKYLDSQVSEMTERQCEITYMKLKNEGPITQKEIADTIGIHRVSVNRSMKSANLLLVSEFISLYSNKVKEFFL